MPRSLAAILALSLLALGLSCARLEKAQEAGEAKAYELELQRVGEELEDQSKVLERIRAELEQEESSWHELEKRVHTSNPPSPDELKSAQQRLRSLQKQLEQEQAKRAAIEQKARRLLPLN